MKTIRTYNSLPRLYNDKNVLENHGIICYTADEHMNIIIGTAISEGYKLQVGDEDAERAIEILNSLQ